MKLIEFKPPPALKSAVGEGLQEGQRMELMGEFRVKDNGNWCLIAVEGVPMPGYDEAREYPEKSEFVKNYQGQMMEAEDGSA